MELPDELIGEIIGWFTLIDPACYHKMLFQNKQWYRVIMAKKRSITNYRDRHAAIKRCDYLSLILGPYNHLKVPQSLEPLIEEAVKQGYAKLAVYLVVSQKLPSLPDKFAYITYKSGNVDLITFMEQYIKQHNIRVDLLYYKAVAACANGDAEIVEAYLSVPNRTMPIEDTSFGPGQGLAYRAAKYNQTAILKIIAKYRHVPLAVIAAGAIKGGHCQSLLNLIPDIKRGDDPNMYYINETGSIFWSCVTDAVDCDNLIMLEDLLIAANLEHTVYDHILVTALARGHKKITEWCMETMPTVDIKNILGQSLIGCWRMNLDTLKVVMSKYTGDIKIIKRELQDLLIEMIALKYQDIVEYLTKLLQ